MTEYIVLVPLSKPEPGHAWQVGEVVDGDTFEQNGIDVDALIEKKLIEELEHGEI